MSEEQGYDRLAALEAKLDKLEAEHNIALEELSNQLTENETLKGQLQERDGRLSQLEGTVRDRTHFDAFNGVARELGVKPGLVEALWKSGGYEAGDGEPDLQAIRSHFEGVLKSNGDFLSSSDKPSKLPRGEGADRGRGTPDPNGKLMVTKSQLNDMDFTTKHGKQLGTGAFEIVDAGMDY